VTLTRSARIASVVLVLRLLAACLLLLAAVPAAARADAIVFRVEGDVWRMDGDGTGQHRVTSGTRYEWPSAADDGTLVAADETGRLQRLSPAGAPLGAPIPTLATTATEDTPAEPPTHVRISPDGTKIAYDEIIDGDPTTLWTAADAAGVEFPGQFLGQQGFLSPSWIGNGQLLLSRDVTSEAPAALALYAVGEGDDSAEPWFGDDAQTWVTGYDAAASRDGTRIAVLEDDAADHEGVPTRVVLRLFSTSGPGSAAALRCELGLEAADSYSSASPTFSPDGTRLAWAENDGIHVATLGALTDCGAIRERVVTLPGAWEPYWTPANNAPPAAGGAGPKLKLGVRTRARPRRETLRRRGLRVAVTISAPATVRISVRGPKKRVAGAVTRRLVNAGTTTVRVRLRGAVLRDAKRLVLRASAPGAPAVEKTIRPRG
jgi:hypothetical protein